MKFYSETLDKVFDTEDELVKAEAEIQTTNTKKDEAHAKIIDATNVYEDACKEYDKVRAEAKKILEDSENKAAKIIDEANDNVAKMLDEAYEKLSKAREAKLKAIDDYNEISSKKCSKCVTKTFKDKDYDELIDHIDSWLADLYKALI